MSSAKKQFADNRVFVTTDNNNIDISSVIPLAETDGTLRISQVETYGDGTPKILGTANPAAATNTALYNVAAATVAKVTMISAANRSTSPVKIRIGVDVGGNGTNTPTDAEWIFYNASVPAESTLFLDVSQCLWLAALDDLVCYAASQNISFVASGVEHA